LPCLRDAAPSGDRTAATMENKTMSTLSQRTEAKLTPFTLKHFEAWAKMQPSEQEYKFHNIDGRCAMGQYMAAQGREWDGNYTRSCREIFGTPFSASLKVLANQPQTFGGIVERINQR
jgi:hypothetical protein